MPQRYPGLPGTARLSADARYAGLLGGPQRQMGSADARYTQPGLLGGPNRGVTSDDARYTQPGDARYPLPSGPKRPVWSEPWIPEPAYPSPYAGPQRQMQPPAYGGPQRPTWSEPLVPGPAYPSPYGGPQPGGYADDRGFNWLAQLFGGQGQGMTPGYAPNLWGTLLGGAHLGRWGG